MNHAVPVVREILAHIKTHPNLSEPKAFLFGEPISFKDQQAKQAWTRQFPNQEFGTTFSKFYVARKDGAKA